MEKEEADKVQRADEAADGSSEPTQGGAGGSKKNRRRRRGKKDNSGDKGGDADAGAGGGSGGSENMGELAGLSEAERQAAAANLLKLLQQHPVAPEKPKDHKFWNTQPVPQFDKDEEKIGEIETKTVDDVRKEPLPLLKGFEWSTLDMKDPAQADELYCLLRDNYVEDDDNMFRFEYSKPFLQWALTPPDYYPEWHVAVRKEGGGKLLAFIAGIPVKVHVHDSVKTMCEINFLCVHKKLRAHRLAPVLIKEVTRRVNLKNIWQALYTAGVVLPRPVTAARYYHRSLNPKKLIAVGFSGLGPRQTLSRVIRLNKLPEEHKIKGIRAMEQKDVPRVTEMMQEYLKRFKLWVEWDEREVSHWLVPREGVVDSFVVEQNGEITDFFSYYHLPSSILNHPEYKTLRAVYSFYNIPQKHTLKELLQESLIQANKDGADVMNALELMDNGEVFKDLKFGPGDGHLQYYLYNWACPPMDSKDLGVVLL